MSSSFAHLRRTLARACVPSDPAECHGLLCGLLCASRAVTRETWLAEILADAGVGDPGAAECRALLERMFDETVVAIDSVEFRFEPLLPEDDESLAVRTRALADWCAGFLHGLSVGGLRDPDALSSEAGELIGDLTEFTRAGGQGAADRSGEGDYAELVEYLRVGVMLLRTELRRAGPREARPAVH